MKTIKEQYCGVGAEYASELAMFWKLISNHKWNFEKCLCLFSWIKSGILIGAKQCNENFFSLDYHKMHKVIDISFYCKKICSCVKSSKIHRV